MKPRLPYTSYFRLKAHMLRLISGASERSFPVLLQPLSLQMRKWGNIFWVKHRLLDACFRREKYKNDLQIFDIALFHRQTNFRATWDPKFDSYAVVGSMKQPRQVRLSYVCGFSIVWSFHVKSNINGYSYNTGWGLSPHFLLVTVLVVQFIIKLVIIMISP